MITATQSQPASTPTKASAVVMGRRDYLSTVFRLVAMELYKLRRRLMTKALLAIGIGVMSLFFCVLGLVTWYTVNRPANSFVVPLCSPSQQVDGCINHMPTRADQLHYKQTIVNRQAATLQLPDSLHIAVGYVGVILTILIIILIGSIVGGEYNTGTVRLMFTRGPTRLQFLLAKIGASIVCIVPAFLALMAMGILEGYGLHPLSQLPLSFSFFTLAWFGHALLYLLIGILAWFVYAVMALFFGILGRSTAAGVMGPLLWLSLEPLLNRLISSLANNTSGTLHNIIAAIPDYFVNNNIGALLDNQGHYLFGDPSSTLTDLHALSVLFVYIIVFVGLSCWLTVRRDVTS